MLDLSPQSSVHTYLVRRLLEAIIATLARPRTYSTLQKCKTSFYIGEYGAPNERLRHAWSTKIYQQTRAEGVTPTRQDECSSMINFKYSFAMVFHSFKQLSVTSLINKSWKVDIFASSICKKLAIRITWPIYPLLNLPSFLRNSEKPSKIHHCDKLEGGKKVNPTVKKVTISTRRRLVIYFFKKNENTYF